MISDYGWMVGKPEVIAPPKSVKGARGLEDATSCPTSRLSNEQTKWVLARENACQNYV